MNNTMLIVDDNEMNREILSLLFKDEFMLLEASDGDEALAILESCQGNVDIVLLDIVMEKMNGFELLKVKSEIPYLAQVPVIVITASGSVDDQVKAFQLGAADFVNKPFVPEIVISRVKNVIDSHQKMVSMEMETEKLKVKSEKDEMTDLFNKSTSEYLIDQVLRTESQGLHALLIIDIDNFKSVNDLAGHLEGDYVIKSVAYFLSTFFRKTDLVGRIGGDEFAVLMKNISSKEIARSKVSELLQTIKYEFPQKLKERVSLSIGLAFNDQTLTSYEDLFKKSDNALYIAKQNGKATYQEYGVNPVSLENDQRPIALLISNNRNICSSVPALLSEDLRIIECLNVKELERITKSEQKRISIIYVDISENSENIWKAISSYTWIEKNKTIAICHESNFPQYLQAIHEGVADLVTVPIERTIFKRRTLKLLKQVGE